MNCASYANRVKNLTAAYRVVQSRAFCKETPRPKRKSHYEVKDGIKYDREVKPLG